MTKVYIFIGAPGCGKGTQTELLAKKLNLPHIDTGSLLRKNIEEKTKAGLIAKGFMDKGRLVPLDVAAAVIKERLSMPDCTGGYVLDGYPRNMEQAVVLDSILIELDMKAEFEAFYFDIPNEVLMERLINRRSCPKCGGIYNLKTLPPKKAGLCDECNIELTQRKDDNEETALLRFQTYELETKPLLEFYKKRGSLKTLNANQSIESVWRDLSRLTGVKV